VLFRRQRKKIPARVMKPSPNRVQRNSLNLRNLLAGEAFDFEKNEGATASLANFAKQRVQHALVLLPLKRGRRILAGVRQGVWLVHATPGEDVLYPRATAKISHLPLCDAIEPARQVGAVKRVKPAAYHQKNLLGNVVAIGIWPAQRPDPTADLREPLIVDALKAAAAGRTSPAANVV
jgi:hypothetical protein